MEDWKLDQRYVCIAWTGVEEGEGCGEALYTKAKQIIEIDPEQNNTKNFSLCTANIPSDSSCQNIASEPQLLEAYPEPQVYWNRRELSKAIQMT